MSSGRTGADAAHGLDLGDRRAAPDPVRAIVKSSFRFNTMAGKRTREQNILSYVSRTLEPNSFQRNPYLPNLINQPDLLVVPSPGRLIALYIYDFSDGITWRLALGAVEDVFELKTAIGTDARAVALMVTAVDQEATSTTRREDMLRLIANTFDFAEQIRGDELSDQFPIGPWISVRPRTNLIDLWNAEAQYQAEALRRNYRESELQSLIDVDRRPSGRAKQSIREDFHEHIRVLNRPVERDVLVPNAKAGLAQLSRNYSFEFDLRVETHPPMLVDFLKSDRFGMRRKLRYYLAKARLIRYWIDRDQVLQRAPDFVPLLVVDGNFAGPDHDPFRYLRMLVSVGWRLARPDEYERIARLIGNANL